MKRRLLAAVGVVTTLFGVMPSAHANGSDTLRGGCYYDTVDKPVGDTTEYDGVVGDYSVTTDSDGLPIGATVTCWLEVNGIEAPGTRFDYSGDGVQFGSHPASYHAEVDDQVDECRTIAYADGTTDPATCFIATTVKIPPECECSILELVLAALDSAACPQLVGLAGTYPAGVTIEPDGDVYIPDPLSLGLNPVYDCPPYLPRS
ncbi:MAG: hypothetical protein QOC82_3168 [Frankiaceae bacterium]|jgi:hypothetical protein|nr:hypothetical protein [Frankiaceae bacterium]